MLLLLCGTSKWRARHAERIRALSRSADARLFLATAAGQRIEGLALARLEELAARDLAAEAGWRRAEAESQARRLALAFEVTADHVLENLESAGVPALALKGTWLARLLYGDPSLRRSTDIDVLVRPGQLGEAVEAARALGYGPPAGGGPRGRLPDLHLVLRHPAGLPPLELHRRVHWLEESFSLGVLDRSLLYEGRRRARPVDEVAMLLLFYARDGFAGLRLAADLGAAADAFELELPPGALQPLLAENPALGAAWGAALRTAARTVGFPAGRLAGVVPGGRRVAGASRLGNWALRGDLDQAAANVSAVNGLLAPAGGLRAWAARDLLPRRAGFTHHEGERPPGPAAWAMHPPKRLGRYALALWAVRAGRRYAPLPRSVNG